MKTYYREVKDFLKNKVFILLLALLMVIAFGYASVNTSISIDDMEADRYVGSGNMMLAAGRFGIWFWSFIQGGYQTDFSMDLLACLMTLFVAINLCILFKRISGGKIGMAALTAFAGMFVSYPLVLEIWEYTGSNVHIGGSMIFTSLSLLILHNFIHHGSWRKPWALIPVAAMMTLVCAGYESIVAVYIFLVFAVLALQVVYGSEKEKKFLEIIRQGLIYAAFLLIGLVGRLIVHRIILAVTGLEPTINGDTIISWGTMPALSIVKDLFSGWLRIYILRGIIYPPITILILCGIAFVIFGLIACKRHGWILLLPGAGMLLSLVLLSIVQGALSPYRTSQVLGLFCALTLMLLIHCLCGCKKKWIRSVALIACAALFLFQSSFIGYFLHLNHRRSEEEALIVRQISAELQSNFDREKPVIFVGMHALSSSVWEDASIPEDSPVWQFYEDVCIKAYAILGKEPTEKAMSRKLPETNVNTVLNWALTAFDQEAMQHIFHYYGYDYVLADFDAVYKEASAYAENTNMPAYPYDGYIQDVGDYIIVHLQ